MTALYASPYSLTQGTTVIVKVQSQNQNGWGLFSTPNVAGAVIQITPV